MNVDIGRNDIMIRNLYQYDYGQQMDFTGGNVADGTEVHYFQGEYGCRTVVKDNAVQIPDYLFVSTKTILAYLYVSDEESGETIKKFTLLLLPREKPPDYIDPSKPEDYSRLLPLGWGENEYLTVKDGQFVWVDLDEEYARDEELAQVAQTIPQFATMKEIEDILNKED